ncbi:MAG: AI-2E family transporter, partial [Lachnospiraceae bacterium]|nr:AI-2E family transporter [Lachnospiraceae bacterium]
ICCIGLFLTGNSYAILVGCCIGLCDALPFFGTGTVFIPWLLIKVFCGQYVLAAAYGIIYLICNFTREFLEPKLIGNKLAIHPMLVLISTYIGLCVFGVFGFFLGPVGVFLIAEIYKISEEE